MTEAELAHLLAWLSSDPAEATRAYQAIYEGLIAFFLRNRCAPAEAELADKTLDRVAEYLSKKEVARQAEALPFFLKFARFVLLEHFRKQKVFVLEELNEELIIAPNRDETRTKEIASQCFHHCLQKLSEDQRQLFLRYYRLEGQSQDGAALAAEFGLSLNALRLRMMRLRATMGACIEQCRAECED